MLQKNQSSTHKLWYFENMVSANKAKHIHFLIRAV
jgi:hypothetical protein